MKIIVKNFRCYRSQTFEFDSKGLFLISAKSGSGKSTILMAINFALYGSNAKVCTFGEQSCSVEFEFSPSFKIIRTKKPNRLVVNDLYEDEVGQKIINETFGEHFNITGYIAQNALNSFMIMSATEKLEFLETYAFQNIDLQQIKNKCKTEINTYFTEWTKLQAQRETAEKELDALEEPEFVEFPFKSKNKELSIKNEHTRLLNSTKKCAKLKKNLSEVQKELNDLQILNSYKKSKFESIDTVQSNLLFLEKQLDELAFCGDEILKKYKTSLKNVQTFRELEELKVSFEKDKIRLQDMFQNEQTEKQLQLEKIDISLWIDYSKEECEEMIKDFKETISDVENMKNLQKQIDNLETIDIESLENKIEVQRNLLTEKKELYDIEVKQSTLFSCPSCSAELYFESNKTLCLKRKNGLNADISVLKDEISEITKQIKLLEHNLFSAKDNNHRKVNLEKKLLSIQNKYDENMNFDTDFVKDLQEIKQYYATHLNLQNKKDELLKSGFSSSYTYLSKDVAKQEKKIQEYAFIQSMNETMNESELVEIIQKEELNKSRLNDINEKIKSLTKEKENNNELIKQKETIYLQKYNNISNENDLEYKINTLITEITEVEKEILIFQKNLEQINKWKKYEEEKQVYQKRHDYYLEVEAKEKKIGQRYSSSQQLKQHILEAESIAVSHIVDNINFHASNYLNEFFIDNPISVNLSCFKEVKKTSKPQINVEVFYKEMQCDLNTLSGGELARVILAFTLSLAEIFNSPLLLLDEICASLDEEMTTIVFSSIKEHFKDIPILAISHQCTEGIFDKVIKL
jgi:DNA repair exonuclease SbcCD ATPase subunit